jgi:hypothetical protein
MARTGAAVSLGSGSSFASVAAPPAEATVVALNHIKNLYKEHALRRVQLELLLETTPRDSRYSSELVELMKREETMLSESQPITPAAKDLIARIERALAEETGRYFFKTSAMNNKRWAGLMQTLEKERERLKMEFFDRGARLPEPPATVPVPVSAYDSVTEADLDAEAARLEEGYNRNWLIFEGFHLQEAFNSQFQRVEKDWAVHETALKDDMQAKRKQLLGVDTVHSSEASDRGNKSGNGDNNGYDARWQHPEKQRTLIHTAPVLAPSTGSSSSVGGGYGGSAVKAVRASRTKEESAEVT